MQSALPPGPVPPRRFSAWGYVDVEGGLFYPYPTTPGRVVAIEVHEGQTVQAGDVLFRLDSTLAQAQLDEAESGVKVAESQLAQARNALPRHKLQVAGQSKARDAMQFKLEGTRKVAARKRELHDKANYVALEDIDIADTLVKECEAAVAVEQKKLEGLQLQASDFEDQIHQAEQNLRHAQALRAKARFTLEECSVKTPHSGSILRLSLQVGELLPQQPKVPPLILCPAGPRIVRAEVEQEWIGRVAVGQEVSFQDDANSDGPTWTGKVTSVADWMAPRRAILPDPSQFLDVRTRECLIEVKPFSPPLHIGQRVRVTMVSRGFSP
jgi:multidrug resistance efflux pump